MQRDTSNPELRPLQNPSLTTFLFSRKNRSAETPNGGNNATLDGNGSSILQIGERHDARSNGNYNKTMQEGSEHKSKIRGNQNLAAQVGTSNLSHIGQVATATANQVYQYGKNLKMSSDDSSPSAIYQLGNIPKMIFRSVQDISKNIRQVWDRLGEILRGIGKPSPSSRLA